MDFLDQNFDEASSFLEEPLKNQSVLSKKDFLMS